jgi:hypothetical protein
MRTHWTALLTLCFAASALANPIPTDLSITGSLAFDDTVGPPFGDALQSGSFSATEGGATSTSTFDGDTVTGNNPLSATFSDDNGDGLAVDSSASAGDASDLNEYFFGFDGEVNLGNSSVTDTYEIFFDFEYNNRVEANVDAFADNELILSDDFGELFFTDLVSDTFFGNEVGGVGQPESGGVLQEMGIFSFSLQLAPGESSMLSLFSTSFGGAFSGGTSFSSLSYRLGITDIVSSNEPPPEPVPEPATTTLLLLGLGIAAASRRRQRKAY